MKAIRALKLKAAKRQSASRLLFKLRQDIRRFADWQEAHSWRGGGDPADIPMTVKSFNAARRQLRLTLREVGMRLR